MILSDDTPDDGWGRYVVFTGLATWAVDELREKYGATKTAKKEATNGSP